MRQKAKEILGFLQDDERLREARKAAKQTRDKYVGYSSEQASSKYSESPLSLPRAGTRRSICPVFSSGDRYDAEPRSRSNYSSSRYDEDVRGPVRPYRDVEEEDEEEGNRFRDKPDTSSKDTKKEEREEAG